MPDAHLYKTKLCVLYQRGNCHRQSCSFAHGGEELRNKPPGRYFPGYRDRSYSRRSPRRFDRTTRFYDREGSRSLSPNTLGLSKSPSPSSPKSTGQKRSGSVIEKEGDAKKQCKVEHQSDLSDSRPQGEAQFDAKEVQSSNSLAEKLHKAEADLEILDKQKMEMEDSLERASEEIQAMRSRIKDYDDRFMEMGSTNQRLERFQKAYFRVVYCQQELRRAESRLQRLVDEEDEYSRLAYDAAAYEEEQENAIRWKARVSDGPVANGMNGKHRKPGYDDRDITDNGSDGRNFLDTGAF